MKEQAPQSVECPFAAGKKFCDNGCRLTATLRFIKDNNISLADEVIQNGFYNLCKRITRATRVIT